MSTNVEAETVIERDRSEVAAYASDPGNDASWIGGLTDVRVLTESPVGRGTRVERVARFLGRRIEYVNEIVDYAPPERLAMRSVKAPFPMTVSYEFDADGRGTRMRIRAAGETGGFYRLAGPLLDRAVKRSIEKDLSRLKGLLEGEQAVAGSAPQCGPRAPVR